MDQAAFFTESQEAKFRAVAAEVKRVDTVKSIAIRTKKDSVISSER